jgi:hypothetical protein
MILTIHENNRRGEREREKERERRRDMLKRLREFLFILFFLFFV